MPITINNLFYQNINRHIFNTKCFVGIILSSMLKDTHSLDLDLLQGIRTYNWEQDNSPPGHCPPENFPPDNSPRTIAPLWQFFSVLYLVSDYLFLTMTSIALLYFHFKNTLLFKPVLSLYLPCNHYFSKFFLFINLCT